MLIPAYLAHKFYYTFGTKILVVFLSTNLHNYVLQTSGFYISLNLVGL